ncbi:MAG: carbohydrate kinase family protein [Candidatus Doudnabacteria bacterium]|nr:carbohydrate kinase family protein [Candidatus Doudnabacteria bacterium]
MTEHNFDIVSIGDTTQDVFIGIDDASVLCDIDKENCMLTLRYADKIPVTSVDDLIGGNASNNAIGSRRLGLRSAIYTIVGDDAVGEAIEKTYDREGVGSNFIQVDTKRGSNYSAILNFRAERTILVYHEKREYDLPDIGDPEWVYLTSVGEGHEGMHAQLLEKLTGTNIKLGFNPGTHQLKAGFDTLKPLIALTDAFFVNKEEAQLLVNNNQPLDVPELCKKLKETVRGVAVVTDGMNGSWAYDGEKMFHQDAHPLPPVERTGAGDSYGTAFISALYHGKSFADALTWGSLNGASVVQYVGPHAGLLTKEQMETWHAAEPEFRPEEVTF